LSLLELLHVSCPLFFSTPGLSHLEFPPPRQCSTCAVLSHSLIFLASRLAVRLSFFPGFQFSALPILTATLELRFAPPMYSVLTFHTAQFSPGFFWFPQFPIRVFVQNRLHPKLLSFHYDPLSTLGTLLQNLFFSLPALTASFFPAALFRPLGWAAVQEPSIVFPPIFFFSHPPTPLRVLDAGLKN